MKTKQNAFTLVELLVVIAIISILAGMLLPALQRARDSARAASCVSRLNQLAKGFMLYGNDFGDVVPSYVDVPSLGARGFSLMLWGKTTKDVTALLSPFKDVPKYIADAAVFTCPVIPSDCVAPHEIHSMETYGALRANLAGARHHSAAGSANSGWYAGKADSWGDFYISRPVSGSLDEAYVSLKRMRAPSRVFNLADTRTMKDGSWGHKGSGAHIYCPTANDPNNAGPCVTPVHNSRANFNFHDGHVESWTGNQMKDAGFTQALVAGAAVTL